MDSVRNEGNRFSVYLPEVLYNGSVFTYIYCTAQNIRVIGREE